MTTNANTGNEPIGEGVPIGEPTFDPAGGWVRTEDLPNPDLRDEGDEENTNFDGDTPKDKLGGQEEEKEGERGQDGSETEHLDDEGDGVSDEEEEDPEGGALLDQDALENTFVEVAGEKVPVAELAKGYLRQSDYTRKTQELAEQRRELGNQAEEVQKLLTGMVMVLQQQLPPAPDPGLAQTNPDEYLRQKAAYDAAIQNMQQLVQMAEQAQQVTLAATQPDPEVEADRLLERAPELQDPKMREQWFAEAEQAARELGFSDQEIEQVADHRLWLLAHYAAKGMQLDRMQREMKDARNERKVKVRKPKGKARKETQRKLQRNRQALERLRQTGSLNDALAVDFELPE